MPLMSSKLTRAEDPVGEHKTGAAGSDGRTAACVAVAWLVLINKPLYPLTVWVLIGAEAATRSLAALAIAPLYAAVLWLAPRSGYGARVALPLVGMADTMIAAKVFGPGSGAELYFIACGALAVVSFSAQRGDDLAGACSRSLRGLRPAPSPGSALRSRPGLRRTSGDFSPSTPIAARRSQPLSACASQPRSDSGVERAARRASMARPRKARASGEPDRQRHASIQARRTSCADTVASEAEALYAAACRLWESGQRGDAIARLDAALRLNPNSPEALGMGGYMLGEMGKPEARAALLPARARSRFAPCCRACQRRQAARRARPPRRGSRPPSKRRPRSSPATPTPGTAAPARCATSDGWRSRSSRRAARSRSSPISRKAPSTSATRF